MIVTTDIHLISILGISGEVIPFSLLFLYGFYEGNSISNLQIQGATYFFELSAGNCHR
jgi:hypothetical protein